MFSRQIRQAVAPLSASVNVMFDTADSATGIRHHDELLSAGTHQENVEVRLDNW